MQLEHVTVLISLYNFPEAFQKELKYLYFDPCVCKRI